MKAKEDHMRYFKLSSKLLALIAFFLTISSLFSEDFLMPSDILAGVRNFGITVKFTIDKDSKVDPSYHSVIYKNYFNTKGMYRVEVIFVDNNGKPINDWVLAYNGTNSIYYDATSHMITTSKTRDLRSNLLDIATRQSFIPLQFLFPKRTFPLQATSGQYLPSYKAAYINNLFDLTYWQAAQKGLKSIEDKNNIKIFQIAATDFSYPKSDGDLIMKFFQDTSKSYIPFHFELLNSKGDILLNYEVSKWLSVKFPTGTGTAVLANIPQTAYFKSSSGFSTKIVYSDIEINSSRLDGRDFYTIDYALATRIIDYDTKTVIKVPK